MAAPPLLEQHTPSRFDLLQRWSLIHGPLPFVRSEPVRITTGNGHRIERSWHEAFQDQPKPFPLPHENVLKQTSGTIATIQIDRWELPMSALLNFIFESYCLSCLAMFPELDADHSTVAK